MMKSSSSFTGNGTFTVLLVVLVTVLVCILPQQQCHYFVAGQNFTVQHSKLLRVGTTTIDDRSGSTTNSNDNDDIVPNAVMIILTEKYNNVSNVESIINRLVVGTGGTVNFYYNNVIKGASISNIKPNNIIKLLNKKAIKFGSLIGKVTTNYVQKSPIWGLDRIDQESTPLDNVYTYNSTGRGVIAYIVDTGIMPSHVDFDGRATCEYSSIVGEECIDGNGHGTHVAGTVGGKTYGVAKRVQLVGIRVLDSGGSGSYDGVIAGIDYVTGIRKAGNRKPMVINMSLGGGFSDIINIASNAAAQSGIIVVVAAGNSNADACRSSPSSAEKVITVGATELQSDKSAYFSNEGPCVEIFAPGVDVESASIDCNTCSVEYSGTSMASPHVAGVAALYLEKNPFWKPHQVLAAMRKDGTIGTVSNIKIQGTPNLFLNMGGL